MKLFYWWFQKKYFHWEMISILHVHFGILIFNFHKIYDFFLELVICYLSSRLLSKILQDIEISFSGNSYTELNFFVLVLTIWLIIVYVVGSVMKVAGKAQIPLRPMLQEIKVKNYARCNLSANPYNLLYQTIFVVRVYQNVIWKKAF